MALSRIWAAFIIIAVLAASYQAVFVSNGADIYNKMVVGKSGDTSRAVMFDSSMATPALVKALDTSKEVKQNNLRYVKASSRKYLQYYEQTANGIISTCKSAVEICI